MELKDKIYTRRKELGLTLEEVGSIVGVGKSTVRKWETGEIDNMRLDKIELLAKALQVTPAYLMGWEAKKTTPLARLKKLRKESSLSQEELARKFSVTGETVDAWEKGMQEPGMATLVKIAKFFEVSVDYLLDRTNVKNPIETTAAHMIDPYEELSQEEEEKVREYIKFIRMQTAEKNKRNTI